MNQTEKEMPLVIVFRRHKQGGKASELVIIIQS